MTSSPHPANYQERLLSQVCPRSTRQSTTQLAPHAASDKQETRTHKSEMCFEETDSTVKG